MRTLRDMERSTRKRFGGWSRCRHLSFRLFERPKRLKRAIPGVKAISKKTISETRNRVLWESLIMEPVLEEQEEFGWRDVNLPSLVPVVAEPELGRETGERRRGRDILIAVDHGPKSKQAFDWALIHFCRLADTIHLLHAVSNVKNEVVYETSQGLMEKLAVEAFEVAMIKTKARIVQGDPAKVICREADRLKPAAVVMGTRGRGIVQSVLQGSVSEYCFHHCKAAPIIIVPGKEAGDASII